MAENNIDHTVTVEQGSAESRLDLGINPSYGNKDWFDNENEWKCSIYNIYHCIFKYIYFQEFGVLGLYWYIVNF